MEELLRLQRGKGSSIDFPLHKDALPTLHVTPAEKQHYRLTARNIVDATIQFESEFKHNDAGQIDTEKWKLAAKDEGIKVYKRVRRRDDDSDENTQPTVVGVGGMNGTLEDAIYAFICTNTDELRAIQAVVNTDYLDAAVVAVAEEPTPADPFRYLGLHWRMGTSPAGWLIRRRDMFTVEGAGITEDYNGDRFGYFVMKSVERPDFPPFSPSIAIRGWMSLCYIFRQVGPDSVSIYIEGAMDLGGDFPTWFVYNYICPMLPVISESIKLQTAKRITALAIKQSLKLSQSTAKLDSIHKLASSGLSSGSERESCTSGGSSTDDSLHCTVCLRKIKLLGPGLKTCPICENNACSKCVIKTVLLALPSNIRIVCCKSCVLKAKALPIEPNMLCPLLGNWK